MPEVFSSRALTMAVNLMRTAPTKVLDTVFSRKKRQLSGIFEWDVKTSSEHLLSNISVSAEATVRGGIGRKNITCRAPRYAEKEFISAADLNNMRAFGDAVAPELLKERVGDEQFDMKQTIDLTREFQAVKALSTDAASDPIKNIRAWKKLIGQAGPVTGFAAFCGTGAMDALINNGSARELLKYTMGDQIAKEGRVAHLAGVDIDEYDGSYLDGSGTRHDLIPSGVFALVGFGPDVAAELFAPVIDLKAPGGVGKGKEADIFFSKMWESEDPSGQWVKVESRPLPVFFRPLCVVYATVI